MIELSHVFHPARIIQTNSNELTLCGRIKRIKYDTQFNIENVIIETPYIGNQDARHILENQAQVT